MLLRPVQDFLRMIDDSHWSLGDQHLLSRKSNSHGCTWSDGEGSYYRITDMAPTTQATQPRNSQTHFPIVHEAGMNSAHVVWKIGDAFLKLMIPYSPLVTREHDTLNAIQNMLPSDITIPQVLLHGEWDGRYFLVLRKVPGLTLHEAWPRMDSILKSKCVERVTEICVHLARNTRQHISGLDGSHLPELFLLKDYKVRDFTPAILEANSRDIGMDCSTLCFYHCDLGPGNVLVDLETEEVAVIDWECAGYVPEAWIRTKFRVCSGGMNLECSTDCEEPQFSNEWRLEMDSSLSERGFTEVAESWRRWAAAR